MSKHSRKHQRPQPATIPAPLQSPALVASAPIEPVSRRFKIIVISAAIFVMLAVPTVGLLRSSQAGVFDNAMVLEASDHKLVVNCYDREWRLSFTHTVDQYFTVGGCYDFRTSKNIWGRHLMVISECSPIAEGQ